MAGHVVEFPLKSERDCRALLEALGDARLIADTSGFDAFDERTGGAGLPMLILGPCPAHALMLRWSGYENFHYFHADFPDLIERLIFEFDRLWRRDVWPAVQQSKAELILHGAHFSAAMTPAPLFRRHFVPYFREFRGTLQERPHKTLLFHGDADLGDLLALVSEAGFDGVDCLATRPLVERSMEAYLTAWDGRLVCWGGLPGTVFAPSFPEDEFMAHVDRLRDVTANRSDVIIGASDNIMPGALWQRLLHVSRAFAED